MRCVTRGVDEWVPDGGPAAAGRRRALDLERRRRGSEHEPLGERRPAQPAGVRPDGTDTKSVAAERHEDQEQQHQLQPGRSRGAHRSSSVAGGSGSSAASRRLTLSLSQSRSQVSHSRR
jgi:hypothetical protein